MKTFHCHRVIALVILCCLPGTRSHAQDGAIATMDVDGSTAFIDDTKQRPSARDVPIQDGNMVRTGQRTSVRVELIPQGIVQLNENSAKLITDSFFKGAKCFAVKLVAGELFINGKDVCFLTNVGAVSGISRSRINIKVDERGTVLTVVEGAAELEDKPASMVVSTSEQLVVLPNGQYYKNPLDPAAAEHTADWTKNYFNASPKKKGSKVGKVLLGIGAALLVGKAIHDHNDDDDDHNSNQPTSPPDQPYPSPPQDETQTPTPETPPPSPTVVCCKRIGDGWGTIMTTAQDCQGRILTSTNDLCPPVR
jgi:hypothetical protein